MSKSLYAQSFAQLDLFAINIGAGQTDTTMVFDALETHKHQMVRCMVMALQRNDLESASLYWNDIANLAELQRELFCQVSDMASQNPPEQLKDVDKERNAKQSLDQFREFFNLKDE